MSPRSIATGDEPEVFIDAVYGNLRVEGWDRTEILLQSGSEETATLEQKEQAVHINSTGDVELHLPYRAKLNIASVHGAAHIQQIHGLVKSGRFLGSLAIDAVDNIQVESVYGDIFAKAVAGEMLVGQVLGNAWIEEVNGNCTLKRIAGDLEARSIGADMHASVSGNAHVRLTSLSGKRYQLEASGDITFDAPMQIDAKIQISSRGRKITLDLPDGKQRLEARSHELTLGNGSASILLTASGDVSFSCRPGDDPDRQKASRDFDRVAEAFIQKIDTEINTQLESGMKILDEQMAHLSDVIAHTGMQAAEADRLMRRAKESSERANLRAQEKMRRAREKLDRKMAAMQRKVDASERAAGKSVEDLGKRNWSIEWQPPVSSAQGQPETSDEERLMILRMLEAKKISLEEAEQLLEALEGKGG